MTAQPDISFNSLVITLATSAAVHLGDAADPATGQKMPPNLDAAGHMLDLLAVLAEKTKGNLTPDEERFLTQVLYELRMRFTEAKAGESRIVAP
ncbi:MAG: DUF1844 domain-containing protein [Vicinamibacterales bacterium]|jgi:hypothetical protein|nr:DUF1844 domain-containing protein [Vicinamibacterales bacterium]